MQGRTSKSPDLNDDQKMQLSASVPWPSFPIESRIRVIRMIRPFPTCRSNMFSTTSNLSFGFTVRGGKEHGTGIFVSYVEKNSEADIKGLQIGDQILWVNQFRIDNCVHKEFVQIVSSQDCLTLKVRSTGILPIKDKKRDVLYWYEITERQVLPAAFSDQDAKTSTNNDITVFLHVEPGTKLGLGICKGPVWKPGIFVLFTKENSLAHRAGLRPGDQILSVNGISFANVLFSEAVSVMKSSNKLKILVRIASGCDLINEGATSDYNSSADGSSTNYEETSDRLSGLAIEPKANAKEVNKTVIKLADNSKHDQYTNQNNTVNYTVNSVTNRDFKSSSILVRPNTDKKPPSNIPQPPSCSTLQVEKKSNIDSCGVKKEAGLGSGTSLSSAIEQEIKKRKEKMIKNSAERIKVENTDKGAVELRATPSVANNEKVDHIRSALVDEFKRVHHRMVLKIKDNGQTE